ncbi:MAG: hypothetical protein AB1439_00495 [candidate division FCPU426 bacterium]
MPAPHFGHLRDDILNPGLGGTTSPQDGQFMLPGTEPARPAAWPRKRLLSFLKLSSLRTGF